MTFAEKLKKLMADNGETTRSLGSSVGVTSAAITGWSNGAKPRASVTRKLADHFKISVETLLDEKRELPSVAAEKQVATHLNLKIREDVEMQVNDPAATGWVARRDGLKLIALIEVEITALETYTAERVASLRDLLDSLKRGQGAPVQKNSSPSKS